MAKSQKPKQTNLFGDGAADLPLFSGTPIKAKEEIFEIKPAHKVMVMFGCPICMDTGWVVVKKNSKAVKCTCGAGGSK